MIMINVVIFFLILSKFWIMYSLDSGYYTYEMHKLKNLKLLVVLLIPYILYGIVFEELLFCVVLYFFISGTAIVMKTLLVKMKVRNYSKNYHTGEVYGYAPLDKFRTKKRGSDFFS